mmetsp:Transcript_38736/g.65008  ORF Transcript_38736/g.65008 Transcript_38736/m.65008 type:complete len:519 (+) Transcript_38736:238-1794(+)
MNRNQLGTREYASLSCEDNFNERRGSNVMASRRRKIYSPDLYNERGLSPLQTELSTSFSSQNGYGRPYHPDRYVSFSATSNGSKTPTSSSTATSYRRNSSAARSRWSPSPARTPSRHSQPISTLQYEDYKPQQNQSWNPSRTVSRFPSLQSPSSKLTSNMSRTGPAISASRMIRSPISAGSESTTPTDTSSSGFVSPKPRSPRYMNAKQRRNDNTRARTSRAHSSSRKQVLERLKRRTQSAGHFRKGRRSTSEGSSPVEPKQIDAILKEAETNKLMHEPVEKVVRFHPGRLGITFEGVTITEVSNNSQAAARGVKVGWEILKVGKVSVLTEMQICEELDNLAAKRRPYNVQMRIPAKQDRSKQSDRKSFNTPRNSMYTTSSSGQRNLSSRSQVRQNSRATFKSTSARQKASAKPEKLSSTMPSFSRTDNKNQGFHGDPDENSLTNIAANVYTTAGTVNESPVPESLAQCKYCLRKFAESRIEKHSRICSKLKSARKVMNKKALGRKKTDKLGRRILIK